VCVKPSARVAIVVEGLGGRGETALISHPSPSIFVRFASSQQHSPHLEDVHAVLELREQLVGHLGHLIVRGEGDYAAAALAELGASLRVAQLHGETLPLLCAAPGRDCHHQAALCHLRTMGACGHVIEWEV
jgi:hypothetical protein